MLSKLAQSITTCVLFELRRRRLTLNISFGVHVFIQPPFALLPVFLKLQG